MISKQTKVKIHTQPLRKRQYKTVVIVMDAIIIIVIVKMVSTTTTDIKAVDARILEDTNRIDTYTVIL